MRATGLAVHNRGVDDFVCCTCQDLLRLCYRITIRHHRRRNAGFIVKQAALDRGSVAPQASYSVADKRFSHDHLECNYEEARESVAVESGRSTSIFIHGQVIHPFRYWKEGARLGAEQCSSTMGL